MTKALRTVKTKLLWNDSFKFNLSHLWIIQRHQSSSDQIQEVYFGIDSTWHIRKNHPRNVSDSGSGKTHFNCFHSAKWPLATTRQLYTYVLVCICTPTYDKVEKWLLLHLIQVKWIFKQSQIMLLTYEPFFLSVLFKNCFLLHSNFFFFKAGNNHTNPTSSW